MKEFAHVGLKEDVERMMNDGILSRDLLEYMWPRGQVDFLLDLMRHTMLCSSYRFAVGESNDTFYLVPSLLPKAYQHPNEMSQFNENAYTFIADFSRTFLPIGVFERLLCMCVTYSGSIMAQMSMEEQEAIGEPVLFKDSGTFWFGVTTKLSLRSNDSEIIVSIVTSKTVKTNRTNAAKSGNEVRKYFSVVSTMLEKISFEIMNRRLSWETLFVPVAQAETRISYKVAKKSKLWPWFTDSSVETQRPGHQKVNLSSFE